MKTILILFIILNFFYSTSFAQNSYKDNITIDVSSYSGVYEGNLDVGLCCDVYETAYGKIAIFFDGDSLRCLYDGKLLNNLLINKNYIKQEDTNNDGEVYPGSIFGKFVKDNDGKEGFLYNFEESDEHPIGSVSFLNRIGDSEIAEKIYLEAEEEMLEFKKFESKFRQALFNKNGEAILKLVNFPFYDKRLDWDKPTIIYSENEFKDILKFILTLQLYHTSYKYQNSNKDFSGLYSIFADNMFFYFSKIGEEFKLVSITGVFG